MHLVAAVIGLALLEFYIFGVLVGRARGQYGVEAPAISGHPVFDRYMRVHQNTMEQLVVFVPAMYLFGTYVSAGMASILGLVFIAGRAVYFQGYVRDPRQRSTGTIITVVAQSILLLGGILGALLAALR